MNTDVVSCGTCRHLRREYESWELPHIQWWECRARPGMANLKSFPFMVTRCQKWEEAKNQRAGLDTTYNFRL